MEQDTGTTEVPQKETMENDALVEVQVPEIIPLGGTIQPSRKRDKVAARLGLNSFPRLNPRTRFASIFSKVGKLGLQHRTRVTSMRKKAGFRRTPAGAEPETELSSLIQMMLGSDDPSLDIHNLPKVRFDNKYNLQHELGRGAFARVYLAVDTETGEEVAIKMVTLSGFKPEIITRQEIKLLQGVANEVAIMRQLRHGLHKSKSKKYVMQLLDVMLEYEKNLKTFSIFMVLEYLSGGELFDRIVEKKHYSERDAALIFRGMVRGVQALHKCGVLHRDLKPENFVFSNPHETAPLKITDFGLSWAIDTADIHRRMVVGSPGYIAPEVIRKANYKYPCDVWSLGIILYILLVGYPPFYGETDNQLYRAIKKGEFSFPSNSKISELARDLVRQMLVVDPEERIGLAKVLKHPWLVQRSAQADLGVAVHQMREFNTQRKLKAAAVAVVWGAKTGMRQKLLEIMSSSPRPDGFTRSELTLIKNRLTSLKPKTTISRTEFIDVMADLGHHRMPLGAIYDVFDSAGRNNVEVAELVVGLSAVTQDWTGGTSLIRFCFDAYDREGTGGITTSDLAKVLRVVVGDRRYDEIAGSLYQMINAIVPTSQKQDSGHSGTPRVATVNGEPLVTFDDFDRALSSADPLLLDRLTIGFSSLRQQLEALTTEALTKMRGTSFVQYITSVRMPYTPRASLNTDNGMLGSIAGSIVKSLGGSSIFGDNEPPNVEGVDSVASHSSAEGDEEK